MPEFVGGLPLHPLVVHFVVVLLVIAPLGALLTALWPAVRRRFGWLAFAAAAVGTVLVPVAMSSGENLASRVGTNPLIQTHEDLAGLMFWWSLGLTVALGALMVVHTRAARKTTTKVAAAEEQVDAGEQRNKTPALVMIVLAVLTVGVAVGTGIHVFRVGDAGSRAVWEGIENLPPQNGG
ncbi:DUF2231 domain-containing protein [Actinophytocola glycyrrhizae]|uniref:DUF2231 domain-containing protein n=1 Tax=Actinophytocola glycyrrhizae TaxID=2044873 RepID=A0ABV9RTW1_9PSEU